MYDWVDVKMEDTSSALSTEASLSDVDIMVGDYSE